MDIDPVQEGVILYVSLLFSLCVHEAAHAAAGNLCGDDTARLQGRLTLNPLVHIDLLGTVILPLMMIATTGWLFGWAKPVPLNPRNLNNIRRDPVLIAMAGPASNFLLALFFIFLARLVGLTVGADVVPPLLFDFFFYIIFVNFILMVFNLIPVPPLDGHYLLNYFLPPEGQEVMQRIGPFGILIVIIVGRPVFAVIFPKMASVVTTLIGPYGV